MFCPFCTNEETKVVDSRLVAGGSQIKRRRECTDCGERFSTYEEAELVMPRIIKSNEREKYPPQGALYTPYLVPPPLQ